MLRVLDLFSGVGGFSLGLERTGGFKTVAFCEIEEFPRRECLVEQATGLVEIEATLRSFNQQTGEGRGENVHYPRR